MGEAVLLTLLAGAALMGLFSRSQPNAKRLRVWKEAAVSCGLQLLSERKPFQAWKGPIVVRFEPDEKGRSTRIVAVVSGPPDFVMVRLRPEQTFLDRSFDGTFSKEIEVGDASFDGAFLIEGPAPMVLALLDAETRRLLLRLSSEIRLELFLGALRADVPDEQVPSVLPLLLDIGQRLAQSMDIPRRLAGNAKGDSEAGVRLQNLLLLIRELPGEPGTVEALRAASADPSPEVRLRAAKALGTEGREILFELAESLVDDPVSAEAVSTLGRELPFECAKTLFDRAVSGRCPRTARACLETLGQSGAPVAVDVLVKVMEQEADGLAAAAAEALGATGSPAAEPPLILALRREPPDLRMAAASTLGRIGSAAAVLPLKEAAEAFWLAPEFGRVTRQAIAEIQSRLPGASPGQLSLAGAEAGQLSLADDPAGQLSLTREPERAE